MICPTLDERIVNALIEFRTRMPIKKSGKKIGQGSNKKLKKDHLEVLTGRPMIIEKGMALQELGTTPIPSMMNRKGWATYTSTPPKYCRRIVEEFYAGMNPRDYKKRTPVMVRGVEVRVDIA
ncbi:hypothetical protein Dsin_018722 [Dipteronia sinensis]|uniref:Uncharacterized protein n=1 Tax=Dipteronia sinensis TaxID=43782 RepID=A0AAE0A7D8_9ROSI|nr:hypothetical protein Dsin_018722 [Dipteronia sinensis]